MSDFVSKSNRWLQSIQSTNYIYEDVKKVMNATFLNILYQNNRFLGNGEPFNIWTKNFAFIILTQLLMFWHILVEMNKIGYKMLCVDFSNDKWGSSLRREVELYFKSIFALTNLDRIFGRLGEWQLTRKFKYYSKDGNFILRDV